MPTEEHIQYVPEPPAVALRIVVGAAAASLLLLVGSIAGLHAVYQDAVPLRTVPAPQAFPQPRVVTQAADVEELHRLAASQNRLLATWGWANDRHTLVHIPIGRAMQIIAQKGSDALSPLEPAQPALSSPTAAAEQAITPTRPSATENAPQEKTP